MPAFAFRLSRRVPCLVLAVIGVVLSWPTSARSDDDAAGFFRRVGHERATEREDGIEEIRRRAVVLDKGTSASSAKQKAVQGFPLTSIHPTDRPRVLAVLDDVSLFRRLPTIAIPVDHDIYDYFLDNPDVAVSIWQAMKITKLEMKSVGPGLYEAIVEEGTEGTLEVLHHTPGEMVVLCDGTYKPGALFQPVRARAILHLRSTFGRGKDGRTAVRHRVDMFVTFPSQTVETAARIVSPVSNMIIDRNFSELSLFLHMMTLLAEQRPGTVVALTHRLEGVTEHQRQDLLRVASEVHGRSRQTLRGQSPAVPRRTAARD